VPASPPSDAGDGGGHYYNPLKEAPDFLPQRKTLEEQDDDERRRRMASRQMTGFNDIYYKHIDLYSILRVVDSNTN